MSQLFQGAFRPPGETRSIYEAADTPGHPSKVACATSLPLLLLPDCSARRKPKNAIDLNYSRTAETRNYHFPHVFNVCGCLYVNNTWKQRHPLPADTSSRNAPAPTAPAGIVSREPQVSGQVFTNTARENYCAGGC